MKNLSGGVCLLALAMGMSAAAARAQEADARPGTAGAPPAAAARTHDQEKPRDTGEVAEVIVTAQRRSESLQKTAISVEVVQGKAIQAGGITNSTQLTSLIPSVQIGSSGAAPSIFLRGVGAYSSTAGQSPAVPFYIDGVYVGRSQSVASEFYDVERVELLKGPQGTLYGRNASGGAFNIITARPRLDVSSGEASLELGNYNSKDFEAAINVPLSSTLALRASTQIVDRDGYTTQGGGDDSHESGRLKLLWQPDDKFSVLLNGSVSHVGGQGAAYVLLNHVPGWTPLLDATDPRSAGLYNSAPLNVVFGPGTVTQPPAGSQFLDLDFYNISAEVRWALGPIILTFEPAYRRAEMSYSFPAPFLNRFGAAFGDQPARPETSDQTSVELRAENANPGKLKYVAGFYFYNEDQYQQFLVNGGTVQNVDVTASYGTRSYALFGQSTYALTSAFRLTGGLRLTSDERSIGDGAFYYLQPSLVGPTSSCFVPLVIQGATECVSDRYAGDKTFKNVSWKGGFELDVFGNDLLYGNVSRGFKAGGFNTQSTADAPGSATVVGGAQAFQPETLTAYEGGLKSRFLHNRLQLNIEAYYWDYKDHQEPKLSSTPSGSTNLIYFNAGKSRIYGVDVTALARPWAGATVNGSLGFADSRYENFVIRTPTAFTNPAQTGCRTSLDAASNGAYTLTDCSGFPIARTPKYTASAGISQTFHLPVGDLVAATDATYASSRYLSTEFLPIEKAAPYALVNLSLTYTPPGARWSLTGFVRNVNDGHPYTFTFLNTFANAFVANIGAPRTYGARVSVRF